MNELIAPDIAFGSLTVALAILYAAWHEYTEKNRRDANLLAAVGVVSLMGSAQWLGLNETPHVSPIAIRFTNQHNERIE